jgi:hypothetical protein
MTVFAIVDYVPDGQPAFRIISLPAPAISVEPI